MNSKKHSSKSPLKADSPDSGEANMEINHERGIHVNICI